LVLHVQRSIVRATRSFKDAVAKMQRKGCASHNENLEGSALKIELKMLNLFEVGMTTYEDGFKVSFAIISVNDANQIEGGTWV
jgi:hypothetical protein